MYRIMTSKDDVPYNTWFPKMAKLGNTGVATRAATGFMNVLPPGQLKSEVRRHFVSQRVVEKWNKLPDTIKQVDSVNMFKNRLDEFMFPYAM